MAHSVVEVYKLLRAYPWIKEEELKLTEEQTEEENLSIEPIKWQKVLFLQGSLGAYSFSFYK